MQIREGEEGEERLHAYEVQVHAGINTGGSMYLSIERCKKHAGRAFSSRAELPERATTNRF